MIPQEPRLHAYRTDLADLRLKGTVDAARFIAGTPARVRVPVSDLIRVPRLDSGLSSQLQMGAKVQVFDRDRGYAWVQAEADRYVGYVAESNLTEDDRVATHRVHVPRTFVYPGPDLRFPYNAAISLGAEVTVAGQAETRGTAYAILSSGEAIIKSHLRPLDAVAEDYVSVAESLLNTPYLWGGVTGFGIDCSGLVQLAMHMTGREVLRDSDMQAETIGSEIDPGKDYAGLRRGDLVFWRGHVLIMTDEAGALHASGHTMLVSRETVHDAISRIGYLYGKPTICRRP